ncbi:unnamed protein product [Cuscuta campestris]|uniref:E2 ubiquitin-conjugating enzyme n=2 Tax=Cuscuta sect. Cleistogrammica TaxID=1824901 RepID=A0A484KWE4_9ASTE|nr:hypothetical protein DM860_010647 [Cuscuta australis]VFQ67497.1 unnamed protein product [Cuscuta campestris]
MATNENLPPNVIKQLARELKNLDETPPEGIKVKVNDDDFTTIFADIEGPAGTPYENGVFRMKLILSNDFPHSPPKGFFLTKIFHPNIAASGEICVNALKRDWTPNLGLRHVLMVVRCLLIEPFPESALNEQAGKMLLDDYEEYAKHARLFTGIHAVKPKPKQKGGAITESTTALNIEEQHQKTNSSSSTSSSSSSSCLDAKKGPVPSGPLQKPSSLAPLSKGGNSMDPPPPAAAASQKKEAVGVGKVNQVEKKKMDARKKSLKRL